MKLQELNKLMLNSLRGHGCPLFTALILYLIIVLYLQPKFITGYEIQPKHYHHLPKHHMDELMDVTIEDFYHMRDKVLTLTYETLHQLTTRLTELNVIILSIAEIINTQFKFYQEMNQSPLFNFAAKQDSAGMISKARAMIDASPKDKIISQTEIPLTDETTRLDKLEERSAVENNIIRSCILSNCVRYAQHIKLWNKVIPNELIFHGLSDFELMLLLNAPQGEENTLFKHYREIIPRILAIDMKNAKERYSLTASESLLLHRIIHIPSIRVDRSPKDVRFVGGVDGVEKIQILAANLGIRVTFGVWKMTSPDYVDVDDLLKVLIKIYHATRQTCECFAFLAEDGQYLNYTIHPKQDSWIYAYLVRLKPRGLFAMRLIGKCIQGKRQMGVYLEIHDTRVRVLAFEPTRGLRASYYSLHPGPIVRMMQMFRFIERVLTCPGQKHILNEKGGITARIIHNQLIPEKTHLSSLFNLQLLSNLKSVTSIFKRKPEHKLTEEQIEQKKEQALTLVVKNLARLQIVLVWIEMNQRQGVITEAKDNWEVIDPELLKKEKELYADLL